MAYAESNMGAPKIGTQAVARSLSSVLLNNVHQSLYHTNERGVTQKFDDQPEAYEIRIIRRNPLTQDIRSFDGATNNDHFNTDSPEETVTSEYPIRLSFRFDGNIDIKSTNMDMLPLDMVNATLDVVNRKLARSINASTIAEHLVAIYNAVKDNTITGISDNIVTYNPAGTVSFYDVFIEASLVLDDGDPDNGQDTFPNDSRTCILRSSAKRDLLQSGTAFFQTGNFRAQDMIRYGSADPEDMRRTNTQFDGYVGMIDSTELYMAPSSIWTLAGDFMATTGNAGVSANVKAVTLDETYAYISASEGTGRAVNFSRGVKVIDNPRGQGIRIQPDYGWGHEVFFPKSVVAIVNDGSFNLSDATYPWVATNKVIGKASQS